jgi:hypothetical protein
MVNNYNNIAYVIEHDDKIITAVIYVDRFRRFMFIDNGIAMRLPYVCPYNSATDYAIDNEDMIVHLYGMIGYNGGKNISPGSIAVTHDMIINKDNSMEAVVYGLVCRAFNPVNRN